MPCLYWDSFSGPAMRGMMFEPCEKMGLLSRPIALYAWYDNGNIKGRRARITIAKPGAIRG
jgi:hypothetical protein